TVWIERQSPGVDESAAGVLLTEGAEARDVEALQGEIQTLRGDPRVLVAKRRSRSNLLRDPRTALDALMVQLGFTSLGKLCREVDPEIAPSPGAAVLGQSLAFGHQLLSVQVASELANRFLRLFTEPRRCFTNTGEGGLAPRLGDVTGLGADHGPHV